MADFVAGTQGQPSVPKVVEECLTQTADGVWVVWAHKVARRGGAGFVPITGWGSYPADAVAQCRRGGLHHAPHPSCTCGFHAVAGPLPAPLAFGAVHLEVALSGRVLALDWPSGGVLFRAARQTVMRVVAEGQLGEELRWQSPPEEEPGGRLARLVAETPRGAGPMRLSLPEGPAPAVDVDDDAGYCAARAGTGSRQPAGALASV